MEDNLDRVTKAVVKNLKFPERTVAHGFDKQLDADSIKEIIYDEAADQGGVGEISAIDGGSNLILKTPSQALVLNRVYCNKFRRMEKLAFVERSTFISKTEVVTEGEKVFFETEVYPIDPSGGACPLNRMRVDSFDEEFRVGKIRGDLERTTSMARRFCEWNFVFEALRSDPDFVVMDGSLQTAFTGESELASRVYEAASAKDVVVAGLSKSSTVYTNEGFPLSGFLSEMARRKGLSRWIADVGCSEEWAKNARVFFTKLHDASDRAFRLDVAENASKESVELLVKSLQSNSKYFAFPGYPYALIDAHTYAKVGGEESMHIRDLILDRLTLEDATILEWVERALTGHDVLDEIH